MSDKFDPDAYLTEEAEAEFNPDSYLEDNEEAFDPDSFMAKEPVEDEKMSVPEAALLGGQQGLTFGFSDEIGSGIQSGLDKTQSLLNEYTGLVDKSPSQVSKELQDMGVTGDVGPATSGGVYDEALDESRGDLAEAQETHPGTMMVADLAGGILAGGAGTKLAAKGLSKMPSLLSKFRKATNIGAAKDIATAGVGKLSKIKDMATSGAKLGALETAGRTEEDLMSQEGMIDVAQGAAAGGLFSSALGAVGNKVKSGALEKAQKLEDVGNVKIISGINATKSQMAEVLGTKANSRATIKSAAKVGKTLVDEGLVKVKQSVDDLKIAITDKMDDVYADRLSPLALEADVLVQKLPRQSVVGSVKDFTEKTSGDIKDMFGSGIKYGNKDAQGLYNDMSRSGNAVIEDVTNALNGKESISNLVEIKRRLQSQVNWKDQTAANFNAYLIRMQSNISSLANDLATKASPDVGGRLKDANLVYRHLTIANKIVGDDLASSLLKKPGIGWKDTIVGGAIGSAAGSKIAGAAAVGAKKVTEAVLGKDIGKAITTKSALNKFQRAKKLKDSSTYFQKNIEDKARQGVISGSAIVDDDKKHYKTQKEATKQAVEADPDDIVGKANSVREEYGKAGEQLAGLLDGMADKDKRGRQLDMFQLLQNPNNRRMLGLIS